MSRCPTLVIAGTHSGSGKTSLALALTRSLTRRGFSVQTFKTGPDFLDPTYLALASGRPCYNLDGWMAGENHVHSLFARATADADCAVVEGVMGLFDGADAESGAGSTAEIARWLDAPVLLVVNVHGMGRSVAALVKGFVSFEPNLTFAGIVANHSGTERHAAWLADALRAAALPPLLGAIPRGAFPTLASRHLGLVTADGRLLSETVLDVLADALESHLAIDALFPELPDRVPAREPANAGQAGFDQEANSTLDSRFRGNDHGEKRGDDHGGKRGDDDSKKYRIDNSGTEDCRNATPATMDPPTVIPAKAGIHNRTGCRIKSGMTTFELFLCRSNNLNGAPQPRQESLFPEWEAAAETKRTASPPSKKPTHSPPAARLRIGVARDEAFHFYYEALFEALRAAGGEISFFSPLADSRLPEGLSGLYLGGGYPEAQAERLSANEEMRAAIIDYAASGRPLYAECGGLIYLSRGLLEADGRFHPFLGLLPARTQMRVSKKALGYVEVILNEDSLWGVRGETFRGHEFHYSELIDDPAADPDWRRVYTLRRRRETAEAEGFQKGNLLASYTHLYYAASPVAVAHFLKHCGGFS